MDQTPVPFRMKFAATLFICGILYIFLMLIVPYSFWINGISAVISLLFAAGYYALKVTKPTLEGERISSWHWSMVCWILFAVLQILPMFSEAT